MAPSAGSPTGAARAGRWLGVWRSGVASYLVSTSLQPTPQLFSMRHTQSKEQRHEHTSYWRALTTVTHARRQQCRKPVCRRRGGLAQRSANSVKGQQQPVHDPFASHHAP